MRQSSIAVPSGVTLRPTRCTRPSRLVTRARSSRPTACTGGTRRRARVRVGDERADRDRRSRRASSAALGERRDRGSRPSGSAPSSTSTWILPSAAALEDAGGVEARALAAPCPTRRRTTPRPSSSVDAAGQEAGREAEVERAVHVAAPQRGEELHVGQLRRARRPPARVAAGDSASDRRPSTTTTSPSRPSTSAAARSMPVASTRRRRLSAARAGARGRAGVTRHVRSRRGVSG